jgi:alpha-glucosidase
MHYETPRGRGAGQFLLGRDVLVAPVLEAGATHRDVWLPEGQWVSWQTGEVVEGGCVWAVAAPLGRTPIFVRAGTALFHAEPGRNADATLANPLALEIRPSVPGIPGHGSLFLDDGASARGGRFILDVTVEPLGTSTRVSLARRESGFEPRQREVELRVPARYGTAWVDGERRVLEPRDLSEDRSVRVKSCALPLCAREVVLE